MALIVIADDELLLAEMLASVLEEAGFDVLVAAHGAEALELVNQRKPALLITDFMMPIMTGLELAEAIRADESMEQIPILLLTGAQGALARQYPHLFTQVLDKPYSLDALVKTVVELVP